MKKIIVNGLLMVSLLMVGGSAFAHAYVEADGMGGYNVYTLNSNGDPQLANYYTDQEEANARASDLDEDYCRHRSNSDSNSTPTPQSSSLPTGTN